MLLPALLVADTHFTSNPRDEYRWGLFPWLRDQAVKEKAKTIVWLGDLSNDKDHHPSALVNRLASETEQTAKVVEHLYAIPGNHEWKKRGEEFWRFLNLIPNVHYMTHSGEDLGEGDWRAYFLPFAKKPEEEWAALHTLEDYDFVFMHQTIRGSLSSNGESMEGELGGEGQGLWELLESARKVYSGDIHVPQIVGPIEYVGSPYHVHFGDAFKGRVILLEKNGRPVDLHYPTISRITLDVRADDKLGLNLTDGDQVKLRVHLEPSEKHEWKKIRRDWIAALHNWGVEVHGVEMLIDGAGERRLHIARGSAARHTPSEEIFRYVVREELGPSALDAAMEIIEL